LKVEVYRTQTSVQRRITYENTSWELAQGETRARQAPWPTGRPAFGLLCEGWSFSGSMIWNGW